MTDAEIIKALECCEIESDCSDCPKFKSTDGNGCMGIISEVFDLINRQKAEIERLEKEADMADGYADALEAKAKTEAYKDLAEKLKAKKQRLFSEDEGMLWCVSVEDIDAVLKEVYSEDNTKELRPI